MVRHYLFLDLLEIPGGTYLSLPILEPGEEDISFWRPILNILYFTGITKIIRTVQALF